MRTDGEYVVQFDAASAVTTSRILSSILVSTTSCIYDPSATQTVILVPSISNTTSSGVTLIPTGTLFVDPGVN